MGVPACGLPPKPLVIVRAGLELGASRVVPPSMVSGNWSRYPQLWPKP